MEQKRDGKQSEDKLQGPAVQDQAVQSGAGGRERAPIQTIKSPAAAEKIVIQFGDRVVKGYTENVETASLETAIRTEPLSISKVRLRNLDADNVEEFCIDDAKAVFLVKSFRGNSDHNPLHFHTHVRTVQGLWVRIVFYDDEVMEGIVHNTSHYVLQKGFLLIPTDPRTNNRLVYVLKAKLKNFEVLGMRNPPKGSHRF